MRKLEKYWQNGCTKTELVYWIS